MANGTSTRRRLLTLQGARQRIAVDRLRKLHPGLIEVKPRDIIVTRLVVQRHPDLEGTPKSPEQKDDDLIVISKRKTKEGL